MICQRCGQFNESGQQFCNHCGSALAQPQKNQPPPAPRPYGWASPSSPLHNIFGDEKQEPQKVQPIQPPPAYNPHPVHAPPVPPTAGYRCPRCGSTMPPMYQSKMSDGGLAVLILMILFCFPLFWIGLLMREEYRVCPACLLRLG